MKAIMYWSEHQELSLTELGTHLVSKLSFVLTIEVSMERLSACVSDYL